MSGLLLPGDPSHQGMVENGHYNFSQDKPEEAGRWYFSRKEIEESSPSRRDGIDLKKETYLRKSYCTFLQDLGMRLKVPQVTIATAIIFCHRFFLRQSHAKNDRRTVATVCMFLAGKVEETPRPLKDVILVSYEIINKKDPAAIQKIKQKEVYEQQKELILLGERVVLATLGFDLNVLHPYKPLVEAIKKFKVAQNALAQVAWNFVNDGLRTSLCLQFKPHHIAAGAIFLAAKFLKVKLPSDGEKVWWQEFDVTPRQLEEVSNQMLELYEQNRIPSSQNEVDGSAGAGVHRPMVKSPNANEESVPANGHTAGGESSVKPEEAMPSSTRPITEQPYTDKQSGSQESTQNQSNDNGSMETRTLVSEHKVDGETKDDQHSEQEPLPCNRENAGETSNGPRLGLEHHVNADQESRKPETTEAGEEKKDGPANKAGTTGTGGRNLDYREGPVSQSPQDAIKKIDRDKVKAALEKRRKTRGDVAKKMDLMDEDDLIERELEDGIELAAEDEKKKRERRESWTNLPKRQELENVMDEDDLIERELEDGIELAAEDEKIKRERRQSWTNLSNRQELENQESVREHEDIRNGNHSTPKGQSPLGPEVRNDEEGKASLFDNGNQEGLQSPKSSSRKRKTVSPDNLHSEGKQRRNYASGYHHNHEDSMEDGNRIGGRLGYLERDDKRQMQESRV